MEVDRSWEKENAGKRGLVGKLKINKYKQSISSSDTHLYFQHWEGRGTYKATQRNNVFKKKEREKEIKEKERSQSMRSRRKSLCGEERSERNLEQAYV